VLLRELAQNVLEMSSTPPQHGPPARAVSSEISDFTSCTHAQSNILHTKYVDKTDY